MLQLKKKVYGTLENTSLVYEVYQTTDVWKILQYHKVKLK